MSRRNILPLFGLAALLTLTAIVGVSARGTRTAVVGVVPEFPRFTMVYSLDQPHAFFAGTNMIGSAGGVREAAPEGIFPSSLTIARIDYRGPRSSAITMLENGDGHDEGSVTAIDGMSVRTYDPSQGSAGREPLLAYPGGLGSYLFSRIERQPGWEPVAGAPGTLAYRQSALTECGWYSVEAVSESSDGTTTTIPATAAELRTLESSLVVDATSGLPLALIQHCDGALQLEFRVTDLVVGGVRRALPPPS